MAIATDFSVTAIAGRPISNPVAPIDNPAVLPAESVTSIAAPDFIPPLAVGEIDVPDVIAPEDVIVIDTPDTIPAETAATAPAPTVITPNAATLTSPPFPLNHARILYDNALISATATATEGDSTASLARIPNTYQRWEFTSSSTQAIEFTLPANQDMDTFCIGSHNLYSSEDGGTDFKFYYSSSTTGSYTQITGFITPESNDAIMVHVDTDVSVRRLKLELSASPIRKKYIGYVSGGIALQMQRPFFSGHTPITDAQVTEYYDSRTETGDAIGRSVRLLGQKTSFSWNNINDTWYRAYFEPFKQSAKTMPFFIAWNLLEYPLDVGMCVVTEDISAPYSGSRTLRSISFSAEGIL